MGEASFLNMDFLPQDRSKVLYGVAPGVTLRMDRYNFFIEGRMYTIVQTGERFLGSTGHPLMDYHKYKESQEERSEDVCGL